VRREEEPVANPTFDPPSDVGQSFPCGNCGAKLNYDAGAQALKCPFCNHQQAVPEALVGPKGAPREIPLEEGLRMAQRGLGAPVTEVQCNDCGATVSVSQGETTAKCAFCGSHQVLAREAAGTQIRPESLVPFKIDKAAANTLFAQWLSSLWFRPNDLSKMAKLQEMGGVYIPFWTFDAQVFSKWTADAGYYYYETEYYTDSNGNQQSRRVQKVRWEPAWGQRSDFYDDTLVCAGKGLPPDLVAKFQTFDTKQLVAYQPHFLAGWRAETYAVDLMPAWGTAQQSMAAGQEQKCSRDVPGDTQRNLSVQNQFSAVTFKHVLLPIWIAAYRYNDKPYRFLVNGQTGEVVGKAPWSFWKIFFFSLVCVAIIAAIAIAMEAGQKKPTVVPDKPAVTATATPPVTTPATPTPTPTAATTPAPKPTTPAPVKPNVPTKPVPPKK
jgi:DNA-directed RNA polymerase subunit RPC12/RpoP